MSLGWFLKLLLIYYLAPSNGQYADKRTVVKKTNKAPYWSIGLLLILEDKDNHHREMRKYEKEFKNMKYFPSMCSATIIGTEYIITAAHCIADGRTGDILDLTKNPIRFYRGLSADIYAQTAIQFGAAFSPKGFIDEPKTKYEYVEVVEIKKAPGYKKWTFVTSMGNPTTVYPMSLTNYDYAVLKLKTAIDKKYIQQFTYNIKLEVGQALFTAGYPGDKYPRYHMYESKFKPAGFEIVDQKDWAKSLKKATTATEIDKADVITGNNYKIAGGQSGSSIYKKRKKKYYTVALVSSGTKDKFAHLGAESSACRINEVTAIEICKLMGKAGMKEQEICVELLKANKLTADSYPIGMYHYQDHYDGYQVEDNWNNDEIYKVLMMIEMVIAAIFVPCCVCIGCLFGYFVGKIMNTTESKSDS